jgi:SlyX protein
MAELRQMRDRLPESGGGAEMRNLRDEIPPHY